MASTAQDVAPSRRRTPGALRTIGEVADDLHVPQHVLRAWETRFPELRPTKKGGRRYYCDEDIRLLRRISAQVYDRRPDTGGARRPADGPEATPAAPLAGGRTVGPMSSDPGCPARLRPVLSAILAELVAMRAALGGVRRPAAPERMDDGMSR